MNSVSSLSGYCWECSKHSWKTAAACH